MKKALGLVVICAMLILVVRIILAQAQEVMQKANSGVCMPAVVYWNSHRATDTLQVESYVCVDAKSKKDSLILIPHLVGGQAVGVMVIPLSRVTKILRLQSAQTAVMKPRA